MSSVVTGMTDNGRPSANELMAARLELSRFVVSEAHRTAAELGFGWRPAARAPACLSELQTEFRACHASGLPLRVLRGFSDTTVFDQPTSNWAMRFVHDTRHVWLGADFSTESELAVASCHLSRAKAEGLAPGSLPYALLFADTVGQTLYAARTGRFVVHQLAFALDCVCHDFDSAVSREVVRSRTEGPFVGQLPNDVVLAIAVDVSPLSDTKRRQAPIGP